MRVLFVASEPPGTATYRYRSENIADCLRRAGHDVGVVYVGDSRVRVRHDVVVLHRVCTVPEGLAFARAARETGAALVYSTDDTVFDADSFPDYGEPWGAIRAFAPRHAAMLAEADAVLVSTDYIASETRRIFGADKPVFTVRNFLSPELVMLSRTVERERPRERRDFVTFGYLSGSATHNADFEWVAPSLYEILLTRERARLLVAGSVHLPANIEEFTRYGKLVRTPFVPWRKLPSVLAEVDVNLAPLSLRHSFVRGKSEIKFLEAAATGIPTVATTADGFAEAVPADAAVFCPENRDWQIHLESLMDTDVRLALGDRAYAHVLLHGTADAHTPHIVATFEQIAALPRRGQNRDGQAVSEAWVNTPFAPVKYLAKAILRRLR